MRCEAGIVDCCGRSATGEMWRCGGGQDWQEEAGVARVKSTLATALVVVIGWEVRCQFEPWTLEIVMVY
jgi:hypothetical protein